MRVLLAGSIAAMLSWFFNKLVLRTSVTTVIIFLVPLIEETSKSLLAVLFLSPIVITHLLFGMIEAVYDLINGKNGFLAGMVSILGHSFFGYITYTTLLYSRSIIVAILGGYLIHMLWNLFVMKYIVTKTRRNRF